MNLAALFMGLSAALCLTAAVVADADAKPAKRPVILTTDCGADMDDQWALAHLALCPEIDLRGIVTTHALNLPDPKAEYTARMCREVLDHMPLGKHPPVYPGSNVALSDKKTPRDNPGVQFLLKQSHGFTPKHRLTILVIGAATDVASALLLDPTLAQRIDIVSMAFIRWPEGDKEWNVMNDVYAWQVLLESEAPLTVGDQAVCKQSLSLNSAGARALFEARSKAGKYLADCFTDWLVKHPEITTDGYWPVWDEVVTAHLLGLTKSETHPRPVMSDAMQFTIPVGTTRTITWITALDTQKLWDDFTHKLDNARASHAK